MPRLQFISPSFYVPAMVAVWLLGWWLVKRIVFRRLRDLAAKTKGDWDDIIVEALSFPLNFLILASGLVVLIELLPMPTRVDRFVTLTLQGSVILAGAFFLDNLIRIVMARHSSQPIFAAVSYGVTKGLIRGFVIGLGALIFLDQMGISITPILASLGIGSLAVALALQDTLSNFFAGLYVAIDKPVTEGAYVRLENAEEGYVVEVGWRST